MKKIIIRKPGNYHQLQYVHCADPLPGPGELLIRNHAIGINYADCATRMGCYEPAKRQGYPITPGSEIAGEVAALGDGITKFSVGDKVLGATLFGGYTTHIVLAENRVFPIPNGMGIDRAAGFSTAFMTAWYCLHQLAHVQPGDRVLVHSAAGGCGSAMIQIAKNAGAFVVGIVGGAHKVGAAMRLGADYVIDKSKQDFWTLAHHESPQGYDIILDANGIETLRESYRHLANAGRLVCYGFHSMMPRHGGKVNRLKLAWDTWCTPRFDPIKMSMQNRSVMACDLSSYENQAQLLEKGMGFLFDLFQQKKIKPPKTTEYAFENIREAHAKLESGQVIGKLVLICDHS